MRCRVNLRANSYLTLGGLIVADVFLNGTSVEHATEKFKALASIIFQRRNVVNASFLPCFIRRSVAYFANTIPPFPVLLRGIEFLLSYFADGLYPPHHIEKALKEVFGAERGILDWSYATSTGTRVGLPVATIDAKPSCRLFTNYNGVGERKRGQGTISVLRWEKANASDRPRGKSERRAWQSPESGLTFSFPLDSFRRNMSAASAPFKTPARSRITRWFRRFPKWQPCFPSPRNPISSFP